MSNTNSIVRQLQADAVDPRNPVATTLRLAKVIATKLDQSAALEWINRELDGYMDLRFEDVPSYRVLRGEPKAFNPYQGWQPIIFNDPEIAERFSKAPIGLPIGAIEDEIRSGKNSNGQCTFPYPVEMQATLRRAIRMQTDVTIFLAQNRIVGIVEAVRNLVLDWSLELEKAGILGEGMVFTATEKTHSGPVTQKFIIQNVGVLGNVSDGARVTNTQTVNGGESLARLQDFLAQTKTAMPLLPVETAAALRPVIEGLEIEVEQTEPDSGKVKSFLQSAKTICEAAAGNLAASGIIVLITRLFAV
jgi:hypothetical protein